MHKALFTGQAELLAELAGDAVVNVVCSEAGMALSKMAQGADFQKRYKERIDQKIRCQF